jgi:uncharacterized protein
VKLPTAHDIEQLHKKYTPSNELLDLVFTHSQIVWDIAHRLITDNDLPVDSGMVRVGCLLHDIGVYAVLNPGQSSGNKLPYITHGIHGEAILKAEGFQETIWRFASCHTGVGLTKQDIYTQNLPLPPQDYIAKTPEEALVMYADKFHSKTDPPLFNSYEWYRADIARFGKDKVTALEHLAQQFGIPDLAPLVSQYQSRERSLTGQQAATKS